LFALAEKEWVCSLSCIDFNDVIYEPYVEFSKKIIGELKKDGAQFIIGNKRPKTEYQPKILTEF